MPNHQVVSRREWLQARKKLLAQEKDFTRERDRLSAERRALPWVRVDRDYRFTWIHRPDGRQFVTDLPNDAFAPGVKAALGRDVSVLGSA